MTLQCVVSRVDAATLCYSQHGPYDSHGVFQARGASGTANNLLVSVLGSGAALCPSILHKSSRRLGSTVTDEVRAARAHEACVLPLPLVETSMRLTSMNK